MKTIFARLFYTLFAITAIFFSLNASAANYSVHATWSDPTPTGPDYTASYEVEWKVNGGTVTPINALTTTSATWSVTANTGDNIEARVRAVNTQGPINGAWTIWYSALAPGVPTTPLVPTGVVITITPQ